ncbi:Asparaginase [Gracilaria domingensis]|nr:Asparaginase [Gracilaria domingensis]
MPPVSKWAIALHGGAGVISRDTVARPYEDALNKALQAGQIVLEAGFSSESWDAVGLRPPPLALAAALVAVECMEDCPLFNAGSCILFRTKNCLIDSLKSNTISFLCVHLGHGAVLNDRGFVENEAAVIDGSTRRAGSVCGLRTVKHPARLAAVVYTSGPHQMIGFSAAERLADRYPALIERADPAWFITDRRQASLHKAREQKTTTLDHSGGTFTDARFGITGYNDTSIREKIENEGETVGATVADGFGNVACVTSTGGVTNKWEGRIGDTPLIGAGSYASNDACALSGTGWGEQFIRFSAASRVALAVEWSRMSLKDAMYEVVHNVFPDDTGGFVGVTPSGEVCMDFNSVGMFRGCRTWRGEDFVKIWD